MFPSKKEFQELIDLCNVDRFIEPEIDINDANHYVTNSFSSLMSCRKRAYKDDFVKLPAYLWIAQKNKTSYDRAMNIFFENDYDIKVYADYADRVLKKHRRRLENKALLELSFNRLRAETRFLAKKMQQKEKMLEHIAKCFMNFFHSSEEITPAEFKQDIKDAIKALEVTKKCYQKLEKYNDIFYGYKISKQHDFIEYHLTALKGLEKEYIFPSKKINEQYDARMFIVSILRYFLTENMLTKERENSVIEFKYVLGFIMNLMNFNFFENPITEVNVRKIINDEIDRKFRAESVDKSKNIKSSEGYNYRGLEELLGPIDGTYFFE